MAIDLRKDENVLFRGHLSKWTRRAPMIYLILGILTIVGGIGVIFLLISIATYIHVKIASKYNQYLITNQRLYVELGWINKALIEVQLNKINDIGFSQSLFEKWFDNGKILVFTGNDKSVVIKGIGSADVFRSKLSEAMQLASSKRG